MIFRLISLIFKGAVSLNTPTNPDDRYHHGLNQMSKDYFDENCPFQFGKRLLGIWPVNIDYYQHHLQDISLMRNKQDTKFFEIYETNPLNESQLALNVRMVFEDFVVTGVNSHKKSVITRNELFVLVIDEEKNQLEIRSSIESDINEKMLKKDFSDYLFNYINKIIASEEAINY